MAKALARTSRVRIRNPRLALAAGQMLRDATFGEVSRLAGPPTAERDPILAAVKAAQPRIPPPHRRRWPAPPV